MRCPCCGSVLKEIKKGTLSCMKCYYSVEENNEKEKK